MKKLTKINETFEQRMDNTISKAAKNDLPLTEEGKLLVSRALAALMSYKMTIELFGVSTSDVDATVDGVVKALEEHVNGLCQMAQN